MTAFRRVGYRKNIAAKLAFALGKRRTVNRKQHCYYERRLRIEGLESRQMLTTVTTNLDVINASDGVISLREAIRDTLSGTIDFASGLNGTTIALNSVEGELVIDGKTLTIDASMLSSRITINAGKGTNHELGNGDGFRIFHITDPTNGSSPPLVTMKNLTLTGGDVADNGGAIFAQEARLVLENCIIDSNSALQGGGITVWANNSTGGALNYLTLRNTRIQNNTAFSNGSGGAGGGVWVQASSADISILQSSSITGNTAQLLGGGMYVTSYQSEIDIADTSISDNTSSAGAGGGVRASNTNSSLTIARTTISGNKSFANSGGGLAIYPSGGSVTIDKSTINSNKAYGSGSNGAGAYIAPNSSLVTISGTVISGNQARGTESNTGGLGIFAADSTVLLDHVEIKDNLADDDVGGLFVGNTRGTVTMQHSTISGNTANDNTDSSGDGAGGAWFVVYQSGSNTIKYSTISGNQIVDATSSIDTNKQGGGLFVANYTGTTTEILNTTISGNSADGFGGGIKIGEGGAGSLVVHGGTVHIAHSTITDNRANSNDDMNGVGGGIDAANTDTTVTLDHTIVAGNWNGSGNTTRDDIKNDISTPVAATWSLIGDGTGATITGSNNQIGNGTTAIDPFLLPLADNGGPTMTHALQAFSTARNMGDPSAVAGANGVPQFDQRGTGFSRKVGRIDIGAYEAASAVVCVSTIADESDSDRSFGDFSLREAVDYANTAGEPVTICLPTGEYNLTHSGGDLDIAANANTTIIGDGAGLSVVTGGNDHRIFDVAGNAVLAVSRLTVALGDGVSNSDNRSGAGIRVQNTGVLHMDNCAVVGNETGGWGLGGGIYFAATASGSIESSVITANHADQETGGLYLAAGSGGPVTLKSTIIANNSDSEETENPDIFVGAGRTFTSLGYNRFTSASGFTLHSTDYIGSADYVVTSVADTYDGDSDPVNMSIRDAIHQANITGGTQEIWLPAWTFVLTRDRATFGQGSATDMDVSFGDLDILDSLIIRGIGPTNNPTTRVGWATGLAVDKVFELVGDYNSNGIVDNADHTNYTNEQGQSGPNITADGDDDGDVDTDDYNPYRDHIGNEFDGVLFV